MDRRRMGACGERLAEEYLSERGVRILERNFRSPQGEIDLIGRHGKYLVFVEVKYRSGSGKGFALEAVGSEKQRRICRAADTYRCLHGLGTKLWLRYDVVAIQGTDIQWVQNAFPHIYR